MFTFSSSVTAIKLSASEIPTSSNISFSKPSPFITVTDLRFEAKNSDLFLLNSINLVDIFLSSFS